MSNPKKTHELTRQSEQLVKKTQKHDANLQKNSTLYFQVGLIVCLLTAYGLLEMKFETAIQKEFAIGVSDEPTEISIDNFKVYEEPVLEDKPEPLKKKVLLNNNIQEVDNDFKIKDPVEFITSEQNTTSEKILDPGDLEVIDVPVDMPVPFFAIQNAPIYPGCEKAKNNKERKKCMSQKITKLIQRQFNGSDIASNYGLTGRQKIQVQFTIDKTGHVTDIKTRAPHPKLNKEAERVINKIPEMTPGKQRDRNVGVIYSLPIVFQVE